MAEIAGHSLNLSMVTWEVFTTCIRVAVLTKHMYTCMLKVNQAKINHFFCSGCLSLVFGVGCLVRPVVTNR